jgi:hypothetical protein
MEMERIERAFQTPLPTPAISLELFNWVHGSFLQLGNKPLRQQFPGP